MPASPAREAEPTMRQETAKVFANVARDSEPGRGFEGVGID
jgi:hypothetical protein